MLGINSVVLESLGCAYCWLAVCPHNRAVEQSLQLAVGGPSRLWAVILLSAPAHLWSNGKTAHGHLAHTLATVTPIWQLRFSQRLCFVPLLVSFSHLSCALAGRAAATRCPSWWWATSGTCSASASCPAGQCRSWWRRRGNAATWSALQNSTGTWCCSSKSCWASPWRVACARTTPPSACRGLSRGTAAPSCDPEGSLHLWSGGKGLLI